MTNIFIEEITYLSVDEVKMTSHLWNLKTDDEIKKYVRKAEKIIDSIIEKYGTKQNINQKTIFPTIEDGLPIDAKQACLLLSECLYLKEGIKGKPLIISEKRRGNQVNYQYKENKYSNYHECIDEDIYILIEKYIAQKSGNEWFIC